MIIRLRYFTFAFYTATLTQRGGAGSRAQKQMAKIPCGISFDFRQAPLGQLSLQHRSQISLKVIHLTHVHCVQRCSLMALQQIDRLTGASRYACPRRQFYTPGCPQLHDDRLRAICYLHLDLRTFQKRTLPLTSSALYILSKQTFSLPAVVKKYMAHVLAQHVPQWAAQRENKIIV